jgi:hypothetical protein
MGTGAWLRGCNVPGSCLWLLLVATALAGTNVIPGGTGGESGCGAHRQRVLRLRGGSAKSPPNGFFFSTEDPRNGATGPPGSAWTTNSHYELRQKPDGSVMSDHELKIQEYPGGYHPLYGDLATPPLRANDLAGFASSDPSVVEAIKGKAYLSTDYLYDNVWAGSRSAAMQQTSYNPPSDAYLLDDHYQTGLREEPLHEHIAFRKPARVGQWLDLDGSVMLDYDGSVTNIHGANISDHVRCTHSHNLLFDPRNAVSAMDGLDIPLGLSLNAVAMELNEDAYTAAIRQATNAEPDLMLCQREEEALELRLQAACEGIVQDQEGVYCWDTVASITQKVHGLVDGGADFNWADDWGWTPLHCAVSNGNVPAIHALFKYLPVLDLEIPSEPNGWTVLFRAAYRGYAHVLTLLLEAGANPWHVDAENYTAVEIAARYNSTACIPVLLHYMGEEAANIRLHDLMENAPMPLMFRQHGGPETEQCFAEGWPVRAADLTHDSRPPSNLSQTSKPWTAEDEEMQELLHFVLERHRNETGVAFAPEKFDNPLNLRIPFPDHNKVFPLAAAYGGDKQASINYTALTEAEIVDR